MADFGGTDNVVATQSLTQSAQERLRQLVARIERLEEEKKSIADDVKPLDSLGISAWVDGDTSHVVLKLTTD